MIPIDITKPWKSKEHPGSILKLRLRTEKITEQFWQHGRQMRNAR